MPETPYGRSNRWLTVILITPEKFGADREAIRLALEKENIESRPIWPPARLRPVGEYAPEGRAYASERRTCICSPSFISKNARREAGNPKEEHNAKGIAHSDGKRCRAKMIGGEEPG